MWNNSPTQQRLSLTPRHSSFRWMCLYTTTMNFRSSWAVKRLLAELGAIDAASLSHTQHALSLSTVENKYPHLEKEPLSLVHIISKFQSTFTGGASLCRQTTGLWSGFMVMASARIERCVRACMPVYVWRGDVKQLVYSILSAIIKSA